MFTLVISEKTVEKLFERGGGTLVIEQRKAGQDVQMSLMPLMVDDDRPLRVIEISQKMVCEYLKHKNNSIASLLACYGMSPEQVEMRLEYRGDSGK